MLRPTLALALVLVACGGAPAPAPAPATQTPPPPVAKPVTLDGVWLGTLQIGNGLRIQVHLAPQACSLDSLDQDAMGIPCDHVVASATELSLT